MFLHSGVFTTNYVTQLIPISCFQSTTGSNTDMFASDGENTDINQLLLSHLLPCEFGQNGVPARKTEEVPVSLLPPRYVGELPWLGDRCDCAPEWRCDPHDACFIHDLCFCDGSGSWHPVKPVRSYWHCFSLDWQAAMKSPSCPLPFP